MVGLPLLLLLLHGGLASATSQDVDAEEGQCTEAGTCSIDWSTVGLLPIPAKDQPSEDECRGTATAAIEEGDRDTVLVMLNGENDGILMSWRPGCALSLARAAATVLRGDTDGAVSELNLYLYDQMGYPVKNGNEAFQRKRVSEAGGSLYVLLQDEPWVWPGVEVGHSWVSEGANFTTVSMIPKVIVVTDLLSSETCDALIKSGASQLYRSPEKHYSDNPKFKNYRTSHTASLSGSVESEARRRMERAARLPPGYSEFLQLVKYDPGQWYKEHHDFFHHWVDPYERRSGKEEQKSPSQGRFAAWRKLAIGCDALQGSLPETFVKTVTTVPTPDSREDKQQSFGDKDDDFELLISRYILISSGTSSLLDEGWSDWLNENLEVRPRGLARALFETHPNSDALFAALQSQWEFDGGCKEGREVAHAGWGVEQSAKEARARARKRKYRVEPNRHVTVFGYLNDNFVGGETVFPRARTPQGIKQIIVRADGAIESSTNPEEREGMSECSRGLRVEPIKGAAAIFYSKTGTGSNDHSSLHGGCPPVSGTKFGLNGFMWNRDASEAQAIWGNNVWNSG